MLTLENFNYIKEKYGFCGSWAIWASEGKTPKSNIEDLTVLDPAINKNLLFQLNPNVIFVGLNLSRGDIKDHFGNFHSSDSKSTDFKIRFAFKNSPYWGGYMTDIIKDYVKKESGKVEKYLQEHKEFERQNVENFRQELKDLKDLGASNPTLIAFGGDTIKVFKRNNLHKEYEILEIYHYAYRYRGMNKKENYRDHVRLKCKF